MGIFIFNLSDDESSFEKYWKWMYGTTKYMRHFSNIPHIIRKN